MAEGNDESSSNWWGSWISSAKTKSSSVFEAVKKDLDELSTAVRAEVSYAGTAIGETFKIDEPTVGNVKKSLSSFFGQVTEALIPSIEDDDTEVVLITTDGQITLTGFQKHLAELQGAEETYLQAPDPKLTENYQRWMEVTEQDQFTQNRLAKHLASSEILNEKYLSLVPDQVPHMEFWQRYLFKRALLEDALANAEIAERKAKSEVMSTKTVSPLDGTGKALVQTEQPKKSITDSSNDEMDEAIGDDLSPTIESAVKSRGGDVWAVEDDFGNVEISEEEQARLLQEYEEEIQERELKKSLIIPLEEKLKLDKLNEQQNKTETITTSKPQQKQQKLSTNKQPIKKNLSNKQSTQATTRSTTAKQQPAAKPNSNNNSKASSDKNTSTSKQQTKKESSTESTVASKMANDDKDEVNSDESWEKDFDLADSKE